MQCSECGGRTIEFKGYGLDEHFKICSRYKEAGHKTIEEVKRELADRRRASGGDAMFEIRECEDWPLTFAVIEKSKSGPFAYRSAVGLFKTRADAELFLIAKEEGLDGLLKKYRELLRRKSIKIIERAESGIFPGDVATIQVMLAEHGVPGQTERTKD